MKMIRFGLVLAATLMVTTAAQAQDWFWGITYEVSAGTGETKDFVSGLNFQFELDVADRNPRKPTVDKGCGVVAGQTPPDGGNGAYMPDAEDLEAELQEREAEAIDRIPEIKQPALLKGGPHDYDDPSR